MVIKARAAAYAGLSFESTGKVEKEGMSGEQINKMRAKINNESTTRESTHAKSRRSKGRVLAFEP